MFRLFAQWRLVFVAALALMTITSPNIGVQAQDVGAVATPSPEVTAAAIVTDASASTDPPATVAPAQATEPVPVTEAPTVQSTPEVAKAATTPVVTEAVKTTTTPASSPPVTKDAVKPVAPIAARVSTDVLTTLPPAVAPSVPQVTSQSTATIPSESTSPRSDIPDNEFENNLSVSEADSIMRGSGGEGPTNASSLSSSSNSDSESITGTPTEFFTTETVVFFMLGGIGLTIIMSLLFVFWRNRNSEDPDLGTPVASDTSTITFPAASMPSIVAPTARELSAWKASGSTFTSRDLPLSANARAKLNAITRLSTEYDMANRHSHVIGLSMHGSLTQTPPAFRETSESSEQSFSIRGYSELSIHHANDLETETPVMTFERDSGSDGYSSGDRYSASGKYSASSRLSSDPGRSSSGWSQVQASKNLDIHRYSSTSSTSSSIVARNLNPASSGNQDHPPCTDTPDTKDSTTSRTDVPNWYSVIESPTDIGRYTASSLESDTISNARESYEL
ncbi:hypothetical protein KXD40_003443 [Peronospora effusa]|uniref:Uncharacterized protein n=1 Tax=Peronospora effusa TaxID=542832 RepID=A0A3M6VS30_9STRA|nr:hypothetical protein DD238_006510 [Peronospora effusa]RQM13443.1 hypothetical protein DD237_006772 [Peronospora effusa]UIZ23064.1 hypothetical protein KXD40_003443 [Peronospora effusa]CAI5724791.1 unnamed protein product [Peronospora effusa]